MAIQKNKRQIQAEQTKLQIFNAALELLQEKAFEDIKIRDIVQRAQVSIGTFYNYYSSKRDVYYETYHISDEYFESEVLPRLTQPTVKERILFFFDEYATWSAVKSTYTLTKILYHPDNVNFDRQADYGMLHVLVLLMTEALQNGELVYAPGAKELANYFMVSVRGLLFNWCTHGGAYDLNEATRKYVTRLMMAFQK